MDTVYSRRFTSLCLSTCPTIICPYSSFPLLYHHSVPFHEMEDQPTAQNNTTQH